MSLLHHHRVFVLLSVCVAAAGVAAAEVCFAADSVVTVSEQAITIPTYLAGEPEPNPMFYFGRNSQGAEGRVYPYPLYDSLTDTRVDRTYRVIYLENEYVRIGVMPEIGGRLFEAVDKTNGYNFVYRQHVIKPALIGLIGAWMSGGVEWNIPHHHRATTFLPVQHRVVENADGSKTVWVGELEIRHRMRWAVGYTLSPGKSYLTAKVRIINRTPLANTMLCFANLAVHTNEDYQIIFPPGTQYVTYHSKREFAKWPIASGLYNRADFGDGTDVSWYKNHIRPNSMFAWNYEDDFFAGYDHGKEAGTMSVADHRAVPGKKFWTWGNGPGGRMWDRILTDDDGPYVELMVGAYSDNQPDYSWLQPFETKSIDIHWYPFRDIGGVKNANLDAAVNLQVAGGTARLGFCTTSAHGAATAALQAGGTVLFEETAAIDPAKPLLTEVSLPPGVSEHDLRASLRASGQELISYSPRRLEPQPAPKEVTDPAEPKDLGTVEELYLAGQRIEQFHDPAREPEPYWQEALRRDPGDARVNIAVGIRKLKQAQFDFAEHHFRKALKRLAAHYTSPRNGEPYYYLGVALKAQGKDDDALDAFYAATWNEAWRGAAHFSLAEIATRRGDFAAALDHLERSLEAGALNIRALALKAAVLRHLGRATQAHAVLDTAERIDPLDVRVATERRLAGDKARSGSLEATLRQQPDTGLETAVEYANAGLWQDATDVLTLLVGRSEEADAGTAPPQFSRHEALPARRTLAYYYLGDCAERLGDPNRAAHYRRLAAQMSPDYVFPYQWEAIPVLRRAMEADSKDARAPYYLGNLLFDWQPEEAFKVWERSAALDPSFALVHRNLAVAYSHRGTSGGTRQAIAHLEEAVSSDKRYALHFKELDELYSSAAKPPQLRLDLLEQNHTVVAKRDDALSREIGLKVFAGKYDEAIQLMAERKFSVWEGGRLEVADHWVNAHLLRGRQRLAAGQLAAALADFQAAKATPDNLPSGNRAGRGNTAQIAYWIGLIHEAAGDVKDARELWKRAVSATVNRRGRGGATLAAGGVERYYRALAYKKLGQDAQADSALRELLRDAERALEREASDSSRQETEALAHYIAGLAYAGLDEIENAKREFTLALRAKPDQLDAKRALADL